ncbi:uncharacterized protein [Gossypium hirsutum]|uniref:Uncharacterized protein isoform X2 n=2 Tax=Gossypium TaxID=3633 RepID=A0A1U8KT92_GOSHI|nr:uncharacterized protein LOC107920450 isoform X2 [Gossypium hirsutum]TYH34010.1 hypothetical protein ES332_D13G098700v1 [Gossypium tomentosum]
MSSPPWKNVISSAVKVLYPFFSHFRCESSFLFFVPLSQKNARAGLLKNSQPLKKNREDFILRKTKRDAVEFLFGFASSSGIILEGIDDVEDYVSSRVACQFILLLRWHQLLREFIHRVVTGYLPSAILILFLYAVPPTMMFSAMEGNISRSQRKRSACIKVLYNMGIPYFTLKLES